MTQQICQTPWQINHECTEFDGHCRNVGKYDNALRRYCSDVLGSSQAAVIVRSSPAAPDQAPAVSAYLLAR